MRKHFATLAVCFTLGLAICAQASSWPAKQDKDKDNDKDSQARHAQKAQKVKITHGPVIESAKPNTATIAWSTNVNASTILKYGTRSNELNQTAEARWGGMTHRVYLHQLKPGTTYFYRVESTQAQGTGSQAVSGIEQFRTPGPAAVAAAPPSSAATSTRNTALHNFHQFLVSHPNVKADLQKDPNLARDGHYMTQHPGFTQFLQTHPVVKENLAQNPKSFLQSEEMMR
jgi:hypothetical protein